MKRFFLLTLLCFFGWTQAHAQIPNGSVAPDFTGTDLDGTTHNLYDLLEAGKTVFIDFSATWCGPCWNYHNTHALETIWETYGPDGTDEAYVFFIESDDATNTACLYGPSGCVGGTQGNWVAGTPYPIIDDAGIANQYQIGYYPTIFCICPLDKKAYVTGQLSAAALWNYRASHCAPPPIAYTLNNTKNVKCFGTSTGGINITPSGGVGGFTYLWSNGAVTQNLNNVAAGTYTVSITSGGVTFVSDPIEVEQPTQALSVELVGSVPVGCGGILGGITVAGVGGWESSYSYAWQSGQTTEEITGLTPGTYKVTLTDAEGCTSTLTHTIAPAVYPVAIIATPAQITCAQPMVQLNGTGSSNGDEFTYQWFGTNGGHIVSGANTLTPMVDAEGAYTLQITNILTTCVTYKPVSVTANLSQPSANAGAAGFVSCPVPLDTLQGSTTTSNVTYAWTGANVVSGGASLTPVVGAPGVYTLAVTNTANGCTQTSTTTVTGFNTLPSVNTTGGTLTCGANTVTLNTSSNAGNPTFSWTGPNGYTSNLQSPIVGNSGAYNVVVNDTITGCSNNAIANVTANTTPPGASASAGSLTCVLNNAMVVGTTPDTNATYAWTGPNNFSANMASFSVSVEGMYNLVVTDPDNGCTAATSATVLTNTTPPAAAAVTPGNLNCTTTQLQLNGTGSAQGTNITYAWSTTNGHIISGENTQTPLVDAVGSYSLLVSNSDNGCTSTAVATVNQSPSVAASVPAQTNVSCFGASNGSATAAGAGGNGTFTYAWSNGGNTASISNLAAGMYVVVITDGENCTASTSISIAQPDVLAANASSTAQTMNGANDGSATANPSGGTSTYTYAWSNNTTTQSITGLAPGTYTVSVTDLNGCTAVQTVTVNTFNCALSADVSSSNVTCFGAANGSASVAYLGGAEPLTFLWSNGATTQAVTNLPAGGYTVNITDANNCPALLNVSILEPTTLSANASATTETASGANDGTAAATPTGGTGTYTYLWNTGATTQSITGLSAGSYTVQVTDQNACTTTQTVVVNSFSCAIATSNTIINLTCAGAANGAVTVVLNGGEAPFTYSWSNGGTSATIAGLAAGTYTATILDANLCSTQSTATVTEPQPYSPWDVQVSNPVCPNDPSGSANVSITGSTAPYAYLWSNGATGSTLANVNAGTYTVQVTDANGCTSTSAVNIVSTDTEIPSVSAQNASVSLDNSGNTTVTLAAISAQFADNCGVASTVISPNVFNCTQLGEQVVTLIVTDHSGLSNATTVTVTVVDLQTPTVICPNDIKVCAYENFVQYPPATAQDNCSVFNGQWQQTTGLPSPAEFPTGTTVQTFTYTDASGNIGTCAFSVTVSSAVSFDNVLVTNDINGLGTGAIDISFTGGVAPYKFSWTLNEVEIATTEDVTGLSQGTYVVVITDDQGCTYVKSGIVVSNAVSAKEPTWLSGVSLQPNPTSELTNVVFATPLSTRLEINIIDATGRVLKTHISEQAKIVTIDCADLPSGLYTVRLRSNQEIGTRKLMVIK